MGLMTNFKFWLIVGNRTQPNEAFCPGPGPLIYIDYSELVSSRPLAVTKIERERVCWDWGETRRWAITGAFCSHAKAKVSFFFFFFFIDTLCLFILCVVLPYFSGFWNLGSSISSSPFYFIHSYRWIWFVRVRENI